MLNFFEIRYGVAVGLATRGQTSGNHFVKEFTGSRLLRNWGAFRFFLHVHRVLFAPHSGTVTWKLRRLESTLRAELCYSISSDSLKERCPPPRLSAGLRICDAVNLPPNHLMQSKEGLRGWWSEAQWKLVVEPGVSRVFIRDTNLSGQKLLSILTVEISSKRRHPLEMYPLPPPLLFHLEICREAS